MSDDKEKALSALKTLYANVHTLSQIAIQDLLSPSRYSTYEQSLQAAYDALTIVEEVVDTLGEQLEYHHWRLGGALEELRPLCRQTPSGADANNKTV